MRLSPLDITYRAQRLRLLSVVAAQAARYWATAQPQAQEQFVNQIVPFVHAGQAQSVRLVDAYMAAKTMQATGDGQVKGLSPDAYTVETLRRVPADEVYSRPFGILGQSLEQGAEFAAARATASAFVGKLVSTDMQLAQTYSARDWMAGDRRIVGYERITAGGCGLCAAASTQRYHSEDLAPIHEHCHCSVSPIYGDAPVGRIINPDKWEIVQSAAESDLSASNLARLKAADLKIPDVLKVRRDPELGLRLVDAAWA